MDAVWYIQINQHKEGPYTVIQLRHHSKVNPDTLVWKEGFKSWKKIRNVPELQEIFRDPEDSPGAPLIKPKFKRPFENDELALDYRQDPYNLLWLLIIILTMIYVIYRLYNH